jgi:hypothetical protein
LRGYCEHSTARRALREISSASVMHTPSNWLTTKGRWRSYRGKAKWLSKSHVGCTWTATGTRLLTCAICLLRLWWAPTPRCRGMCWVLVCETAGE